MASRIMRILDSVKEVEGMGVYDSIIKTCGVLEENATSDKQSEYLKGLLYEIESTCGNEAISSIMRPCGRKCISDVIISKAREIYKDSANLENFLNLMNENHIGGGKLHIQDGKIIGIYEKCYCGLVKQAKDIPPSYCNCSAGWYERLFSSVLEKDVEVRIVNTVLRGSDKCVFEITIKE